MAHEHLYFTNIIASLQQVGSKAVPKRVCSRAFGNPGFLSSLFLDQVGAVIAQLFSSVRGGKEPFLWVKALVVVAEPFEKPFGKKCVALFATFAVFNLDEHPGAVNIFSSQGKSFTHSQPG